MLDVLRRSDVPIAEDIGTGTYRLLFRVLASHPEEVRSFYEDTVAPIVKYDDQYATDLVGTLEAYLEQNCNMNATAAAIYAHRHTVAYRLDRVKELTGLDPDAVRGPRAAGPRSEGLPHHRAAAAALTTAGSRSSHRLPFPRMRFRATLVAAAVAALLGAAPAHAVETGVNETLGQTVPTVEKAPRLGADWVRVWALWQDLEQAPGRYTEHLVAELQHKAAALEARGIRVLVVVHRAPAWASGGRGGIAPPTDPAAFARFMRTLAQRVPAVDAWELWNEQDETEFWAGAPRPGRLRRAAARRLPGDQVGRARRRRGHGRHGRQQHRLRPRALRQRRRPARSTPSACTRTPRASSTRPAASTATSWGRIGRYTFSAYREVHAVMSDHGDGAKPIWMTELGWNTQRTGRGRATSAPPRGASRSASRAASRRATSRSPTAASPPTRSSGPPSGSGCRTSRARPTRAATASTSSTAAGSASATAFRKLDRGIRARRCGGTVDRTPPVLSVREPADGTRFRGKLSVRVRASDGGGTGLQRIYLAADGQHIRTWGGTRRLDRPVVGDGEVEAGPAHAHLPRARQRAERDDEDHHRLQARALTGRSQGGHAPPPPPLPHRPRRSPRRRRRARPRRRDRHQRDARPDRLLCREGARAGRRLGARVGPVEGPRAGPGPVHHPPRRRPRRARRRAEGARRQGARRRPSRPRLGHRQGQPDRAAGQPGHLRGLHAHDRAARARPSTPGSCGTRRTAPSSGSAAPTPRPTRRC